MRAIAALVGVLALAPVTRAELLWNNFQGPNGFDGQDSLSSERTTEVLESWTVDDAVFDAAQYPLGVVITGIRWIGVRTPGISFPQADFSILDSGFAKIDVPLNGDENLSYTVESLLPNTDFPTWEVYRGFISVPEVELSPGRYYFGTRLRGNFSGRNFLATTGNGVLQGTTQGYFQSTFFGYPSFVPAAQAFKGGVTDFAFQVEGRPIVPEPMSLVLLASGVLALVRRR